MKKKVRLEDLKVKSFVTNGSVLGGAAVIDDADTKQTACYHCDSVGSHCGSGFNRE